MTTRTERYRLRQNILDTRDAYHRGQVSFTAVVAACDRYIAAIREYGRTTGIRVPLPSRGALLRM
jgi:hypothetical protein